MGQVLSSFIREESLCAPRRLLERRGDSPRESIIVNGMLPLSKIRPLTHPEAYCPECVKRVMAADKGTARIASAASAEKGNMSTVVSRVCDHITRNVIVAMCSV